MNQDLETAKPFNMGRLQYLPFADFILLQDIKFSAKF